MKVNDNICNSFDNLFMNFPIVCMGRVPNLNLQRAKMVLVANIVFKITGNFRVHDLLEMMCTITGLSVEALPDLKTACKNANVSFESITNVNKLKLFYMRNQESIDQFIFFMKSLKSQNRKVGDRYG